MLKKETVSSIGVVEEATGIETGRHVLPQAQREEGRRGRGSQETQKGQDRKEVEVEGKS